MAEFSGASIGADRAAYRLAPCSSVCPSLMQSLKKRAVKRSEAKTWAASKGFKCEAADRGRVGGGRLPSSPGAGPTCRYFETSCKSGEGVHACFDALFRDVLARL